MYIYDKNNNIVILDRYKINNEIINIYIYICIFLYIYIYRHNKQVSEYSA